MRRMVVGQRRGGVVAVLLLIAANAARAENVGGVITTDTTWNLAGSPYIVNGGSVRVGNGATLTIEPGVEVRFEPLQSLLVGYTTDGQGTLVARGTEAQPILFTSNSPTPAPGDWTRIDFLDLAADATFNGSWDYIDGCILEHVIVEYAGSSGYAAVSTAQASPYLRDCEIRENLGCGIGVYNDSPLRIDECHVHDNQDRGILIWGSNGNTLTGNTITGNNNADYDGGGGIRFISAGGNTLTGNTISNNSAVQRGGGVSIGQNCDSNTLTNNVIHGNTANEGGGIFFDQNNRNNSLLDNSIENNNASSEGGALYLKGPENAVFVGNTIRFNHTSSGQAGGIFVTYGTEWLSLNGGAGAHNTICLNDGYEVYNDSPFSGGTENDIDATNVDWCTDDPGEIAAGIYDFDDDSSRAMVFWDPYVVNQPGVEYCSGDPGVGTTCPCSNNNSGAIPGSGCANAGLLTHAPRFMQPSAHGSAGKRRVGLAPWSVSIAAPVKALHTL